MTSQAHCSPFIPHRALERLARDNSIPLPKRLALLDALSIDTGMRQARAERVTPFPAVRGNFPGAPDIDIYRCGHRTTLPGMPLSHPDRSRDDAAHDAFQRTEEVARFYQDCFGRNSVDDAGTTLVSSVHFGTAYCNAFWNGEQMVYGDGDGEFFIGFTQADDVIAHELTHGITQYSMGLGYVNEAGALNESLSDVFGAMFRQWRLQQDAPLADWRIGADILGPGMTSRGHECLRDLSDPGAMHCLTPQPAHYAEYRDGMDPHDGSGIANHAFYLAAIALGGPSWGTAGGIWYRAMTAYEPAPDLGMRAFADRTLDAARLRHPDEPGIAQAILDAWRAVGLPLVNRRGERSGSSPARRSSGLSLPDPAHPSIAAIP